MDLKGLVNKARDTLRKNPNLIEKGGDAIDKATGNKYTGQVDKAQDAVRKAVGAQNTAPQNNKAPENKPDAPQQ
ncbi:antitoxin [Gordonia alkanivorans]|uniref:antitoxin n=1 Tax=Gordonia alkanivorans TaxID=84096 RepID=UPI00244C1666|nr:antitoxin [Gordonia alkanivorans]MDH3047692.1 antitoxin [Gordonia alkanivorans]